MGGIDCKLYLAEDKMRVLSSIIANYTGGPFPNFSAKNATGAGATDGTEWLKALIDDYLLGWSQALLDHEGLSPDGVAEAAGASQILDAIQNILPPGMVVEWNLNTDPASYGARYLLLNGQGILRANYPELDANVYVGDGNNAAVAAAGAPFFHADNSDGSSPNTAGVYLILPESRGVVARGLDSAASIDPDGASRYLGDLQIDAFQGFEIESLSSMLNTTYLSTNATRTGAAIGSGNKAAGSGGSGVMGYAAPVDDLTNGTPRIDSETRMYNRSTQFAIRY
jgi:hypothetical protein